MSPKAASATTKEFLSTAGDKRNGSPKAAAVKNLVLFYNSQLLTETIGTFQKSFMMTS
jgi:hypothetical protein